MHHDRTGLPAAEFVALLKQVADLGNAEPFVQLDEATLAPSSYPIIWRNPAAARGRDQAEFAEA